MPTILQLRRGTTAENAAYTGSVGELTVDTTLNKVILHDGSTAGGTTVGNLQGNIQIGITGDNEIDTSSGNLTIDSAGGTVTIDDNLTVSGNLTVQGTTTTVNSTTIDVQNSLRFEGATSDAFETNLTVTDPTADRTITLPNATGYVPVFTSQPTAAITDGSAGQFLKTDGSGALSFATVSSYTNSDVDTHINTSTASSGEVLSWNGSDYDWVAQSGTGDLTITGSSITGPNNTNITLDPSGTGKVIIDSDLEPYSTLSLDLGDAFAQWRNIYGDKVFVGTSLHLNFTAGISGQVVMSQGSGSATTWTYLKTVNGNSLLGSGDIAAGGGTSWQAVKTSAFTAVAGEGYFVNTTSAAITVTLPASPTLGDEVTIVDYAGTADTNNITVARNSENIQGSAADLTVSVERAAFTLVYTDGTQGWLLKDK